MLEKKNHEYNLICVDCLMNFIVAICLIIETSDSQNYYFCIFRTDPTTTFWNLCFV